MNNRLFFFPGHRRYVLFTAAVLNHMYKYAQRRVWHTEAGGEIYAIDPDAEGLIVMRVTGPNRGDCRTRFSYNPDFEAAKFDRDLQFTLGMHAVGLWHTHPESHPTPSDQDRQTTEKYLSTFLGDRKYYLMIIVGNCGNPPSVKVWAASKDTRAIWVELLEESCDSIPRMATLS